MSRRNTKALIDYTPEQVAKSKSKTERDLEGKIIKNVPGRHYLGSSAPRIGRVGGGHPIGQ